MPTSIGQLTNSLHDLSHLLLLSREVLSAGKLFLRNLLSTARSHTCLGISKQACAGTINTCGNRFPGEEGERFIVGEYACQIRPDM